MYSRLNVEDCTFVLLSDEYRMVVRQALSEIGKSSTNTFDTMADTIAKIGPSCLECEILKTTKVELAEYMGVSYPSVVRRLKTLEKSGIIEWRAVGPEVELRLLVYTNQGKVITRKRMLGPAE